MSAAVSDFRTDKVLSSKIKKEKSDGLFTLTLIQTQDILKYLGENKKFGLIGFALETENKLNNAKKKLKEKKLDMIVLNNPAEKGAGFKTDTNVVTIIDKKNVKRLPLMQKYNAANKILDHYLKISN